MALFNKIARKRTKNGNQKDKIFDYNLNNKS